MSVLSHPTSLSHPVTLPTSRPDCGHIRLTMFTVSEVLRSVRSQDTVGAKITGVDNERGAKYFSGLCVCVCGTCCCAALFGSNISSFSSALSDVPWLHVATGEWWGKRAAVC